MKKGYVYILKSSNSTRYYIGSTINLEVRLHEHNSGKVRATHNKGPWKICLFKEYDSAKRARQIEYKIKKMKNRNIINTMIKDRKIDLI